MGGPGQIWDEESTQRASYILAYLYCHKYTRAKPGDHEKYSRRFSKAERDYQQRIRENLYNSDFAWSLIQQPEAFDKHDALLERPWRAQPRGANETERLLENMIKNLDWFLKPPVLKPDRRPWDAILTALAIFVLAPVSMSIIGGDSGIMIALVLTAASFTIYAMKWSAIPPLSISHYGDQQLMGAFISRIVINGTELYWYLHNAYIDQPQVTGAAQAREP